MNVCDGLKKCQSLWQVECATGGIENGTSGKPGFRPGTKDLTIEVLAQGFQV
ncbi:hypothetical protein L208DRAFT_1393363 [Tricholoma matsutake]|nr:hypothetical protein L208DRAFT_1393360 [Tricholoma matsutake 945]KAF8234912.1 hypothetical protein L208DRAFT_1393363 [Tricholoma matsutake 945]